MRRPRYIRCIVLGTSYPRLKNDRGGTGMVQRLQSFDDLDGSPATQTIRYGFADHTYEIDLNDEHAQEFQEVLSRYIEHSRKVAEVRRELQTRQRRVRRG